MPDKRGGASWARDHEQEGPVDRAPQICHLHVAHHRSIDCREITEREWPVIGEILPVLSELNNWYNRRAVAIYLGDGVVVG